MTSFDFFRILGPQIVFIGGWGMKFNFLRIFSNFFDLKQLKMVKFVFKWSNSYSNSWI
jgi:hypothetical protein